MKNFFRPGIQRIVVPMILVLTGTGCTATIPTQQTETSTPAEITANKGSVLVISAGNPGSALEIDGTEGLQVGDKVQLSETGDSVVHFKDLIEVQLFGKTEIQLDQVEQGSDGNLSVKLKQSYGNAHIIMSDQRGAWLTLQTDYATIRTLDQGTDFVVCHKPEAITCGVVNKGVVEFTAKGKPEIAKEGDVIYVKPGRPPSSPICARLDEVSEWIETIKATGQGPGLGQVVSGWPQLPCSAIAATETLATAETSLPSAEGMVKIDAGPYVIGSSTPDDSHVPEREISLAEYYIDQFEVTNTQYQQFLESTGYSPPAIWPGEANHPIRGVSWDDAVAYCTWAGKRLPTEAEWEAAARGAETDPPFYPWGDDPFANGEARQLPRTDTYEVGSITFNRSDAGVYDLAGNVWEWVGEPYEPIAPGNRVLRGGRFGLIRDSAYREPAQSEDERFLPYAGFRCASDAVEGDQ